MGIRLAFSGGGFRATFYSLGAYRRLVELEVQGLISHLSSVSGGSITAGKILAELAESDFLSLDDFDRRVTEPLRRLGQSNLRRRLLVAALRPRLRLRGFRPLSIKARLSQLLHETLDQELFGGKRLADLPRTPEWHCNATCLNTGDRFRFSATGVAGTAVGTSSDIEDVPVALAVAASNAFPLLFAPIPLINRGRRYLREDGSLREGGVPDVLYLTDGGVYDNLGIDSLLEAEAPFILLDASQKNLAPSAFRPRWFSTTFRLQEIWLEQISSLARGMLSYHARGVQLPLALPICEIAGPVDLPQALPVYPAEHGELERLVAGLRTDLDAFHDIEIDMLMWAGAVRMDLAIKSLQPESIPAERWHQVPALPDHPPHAIQSVLGRGQRIRLLSRVRA
jgi:NTE family protein